MIFRFSVFFTLLALGALSRAHAEPTNGFRDSRLVAHLVEARKIIDLPSGESKALPIAVQIYERVRYVRSFFGESAWKNIQVDVVSTMDDLGSFTETKGIEHASTRISRMADELRGSNSRNLDTRQ